jgi:hypothetical protein
MTRRTGRCPRPKRTATASPGYPPRLISAYGRQRTASEAPCADVAARASPYAAATFADRAALHRTDRISAAASGPASGGLPAGLRTCIMPK